MLVDLPPFYKKMNPARSLEVLFENTTKTYREISDSVHSKTLETLYTDTFRPENLHAGETTVMDIKTGNPIKALVDYIVTRGKNIKSDQFIVTKSGNLGGVNTLIEIINYFKKHEE